MGKKSSEALPIPLEPARKKLTSCCEKAEDLRISWRKADKWEGPETYGWSMPSGADCDGNDNYVNINFCPWCGSKLDQVR